MIYFPRLVVQRRASTALVCYKQAGMALREVRPASSLIETLEIYKLNLGKSSTQKDLNWSYSSKLIETIFINYN